MARQQADLRGLAAPACFDGGTECSVTPATNSADMLLRDRCSRNARGVASAWQQFGAAYGARTARRRLVCAPKHWQRVVVALCYEIACRLDCDCGWVGHRHALGPVLRPDLRDKKSRSTVSWPILA